MTVASWVRRAGGSSRLLFAHLTVLAAVVLASCATVLPTPPGIAHSIEVRENYGLRFDREWVESVEADPASEVRYGIRVTAPEATLLDETALQKAIELRVALGLSTNRDWVRSVLADPESVTVTSARGALLSPGEAAAWAQRVTSKESLTRALAYYAAEHRTEWAGWYADGESAVVLVTADLEAHRAALSALLGPTVGSLDVRAADWSLEALESDRARVRDDRDWIEAQGVNVVGTGVDVPGNRVVLEVELDRTGTEVEQRILARYGTPGWLSVRTSFRPAASLPLGTLTVNVVDPAGRPVTGVVCRLVPDVPGAEGDNTLSISDEHGQCRWGGDALLGATGYRVEVWRRLGVDLLGFDRVSVPASGEADLTIVVAGGG